MKLTPENRLPVPAFNLDFVECHSDPYTTNSAPPPVLHFTKALVVLAALVTLPADLAGRNYNKTCRHGNSPY